MAVTGRGLAAFGVFANTKPASISWQPGSGREQVFHDYRRIIEGAAWPVDSAGTDPIIDESLVVKSWVVVLLNAWAADE